MKLIRKLNKVEVFTLSRPSLVLFYQSANAHRREIYINYPAAGFPGVDEHRPSQKIGKLD